MAQKPESDKSFVPQKGRWQVERSFAWVNAYRRLTRSYKKTTLAEETFFQLTFLDVNLAKI